MSSCRRTRRCGHARKRRSPAIGRDEAISAICVEELDTPGRHFQSAVNAIIRTLPKRNAVPPTSVASVAPRPPLSVMGPGTPPRPNPWWGFCLGGPSQSVILRSSDTAKDLLPIYHPSTPAPVILSGAFSFVPMAPRSPESANLHAPPRLCLQPVRPPCRHSQKAGGRSDAFSRKSPAVLLTGAPRMRCSR